MPTLWSSNFGKVTVMEDGGPAAIIGVSSSPDITFESHKSIITSVGISEQCNAQFLHTIGDSVYVYTFGDRMGEVRLGGISFAANCDDSGAEVEHGLVSIRKFFHANKVSKIRNPMHVLLSASGEEIQAYLVAWTGQVVQSEHRVFEWSLQMAAVPTD